MLMGSVQAPQCGGAHNSEPAAADRAHTHMRAHVHVSTTHAKHLDPLTHTKVAHNGAFFLGRRGIIVTMSIIHICQCKCVYLVPRTPLLQWKKEDVYIKNRPFCRRCKPKSFLTVLNYAATQEQLPTETKDTSRFSQPTVQLLHGSEQDSLRFQRAGSDTVQPRVKRVWTAPTSCFIETCGSVPHLRFRAIIHRS